MLGPRSARLVGAKADGWSISAPYAPPERLRKLTDIVTESAQQAGRDPDRLVRVYNLIGLVSPEDRDTFHGPVARWVETLTTLYTDYQMNTFVFWPSGDRERQSHRFAEEGRARGPGSARQRRRQVVLPTVAAPPRPGPPRSGWS